jgi:hypothetical protein
VNRLIIPLLFLAMAARAEEPVSFTGFVDTAYL